MGNQPATKKSILIKELQISLTHYDQNPPAVWTIGVYRKGNTYSVLTAENSFCHVDDQIISKIFEPVKNDLAQSFFNHFNLGSLVRDSEFLIGSGVHTSLTGIKREGAAMAAAYYLAEIVERVLDDMPKEHLDRNIDRIKNNKEPAVYHWIDSYNKRTSLIESSDGAALTH